MNPLKRLSALRDFRLLGLAVLMHGVAVSSAAPFLTLFARDAVGMAPFTIGAFMTALSLSGVLASARLARLSDNLENRRPVVLLTLLAAASGYGLLAVTRPFWLVVLVACLFLGTAAATFPQLFAFSRARITAFLPESGEDGLTTLRSVYSLAWAIGPIAGALALGAFGYPGLFVGAAGLLLLALLPVMSVRSFVPAARKVIAAHQAPPATPARGMALVALAFVLYGMSNSMAAIALPLHMTGALGATRADVGLVLASCALFEVPVMLSFVLTKRRLPNERLITLAFGLFAAYGLIVAFAPGVATLIAAQGVRAVVIAITACLGMAFFQDLLPGRVGSAITLLMNTGAVGQVLGGVVAGAFAQAFGFRSVFLLCAVVTGVACLLLAVNAGLGARFRPAPLAAETGD